MPSHIRKPHVENLTDCLCTMSAVLSRVSWFATKIQFPDGWMVKFRGCSPEPSINSKGTFWHIWRIPSGCNPLGLRFRHQSLHLYHSISIPTAKSQPSAILSHPQQLLLCKWSLPVSASHLWRCWNRPGCRGHGSSRTWQIRMEYLWMLCLPYHIIELLNESKVSLNIYIDI